MEGEAWEGRAHAERFIKTIRHEGMNHLVLLGKRHLRFVVKERMAHDRADRFHQGLGGRVSGRQAGSANDTGLKGMVVCRSRLGGMLNFYRREAA